MGASGVTIGGYKTVTKSDSGLASALGSSAVTVMVYADSTFQHYSSGILSGVSTTCNLNHAVLATGYGSNFWKIKNSWGSSWSELCRRGVNKLDQLLFFVGQANLFVFGCHDTFRRSCSHPLIFQRFFQGSSIDVSVQICWSTRKCPQCS